MSAVEAKNELSAVEQLQKLPTVHFSCSGVLMLKLPQRKTAAEWKASMLPKDGFWFGDVRIESLMDSCHILFLNPDTGALFAKSDISKPGAVEFTPDSRRYFICSLSAGNGRRQPVGIMFKKVDSNLAFSFKLAVLKWKSKLRDAAKAAEEFKASFAEMDLGQKPEPGQRITVSLGKGNNNNNASSPADNKKQKKKKKSTKIHFAGPQLAPPKKTAGKSRRRKKVSSTPALNSSDPVPPVIAAAAVAAEEEDPFAGSSASFGFGDVVNTTSGEVVDDPFADATFFDNTTEPGQAAAEEEDPFA